MKVIVRSYGIVGRGLPSDGGEVEVEVPDGCTVGDLVKRLEIARENLWMVSVNDVVANDGSVLKPLDRVAVFPPISGG